MSLDAPNAPLPDATDLKVGVVAACFNNAMVEQLLSRAEHTLAEAGITTVTVERVPGSAELPYGASLLACSRTCDVIIVLGVVIAGDTDHHRVIGDSTAKALTDLSIASKVPIINGILVTNTHEQAVARTSGAIDRGAEFARAAIHMGILNRKWTT